MEAQRDPQTYAIIGAAMEAHRVLGCGFLEPVYQEALAEEFTLRQIPFAKEVPLIVKYKEKTLECKYKVDFICYDEVLVELKALTKLASVEQSQILNYLKASKLSRGLLINFGRTSLEYERFVYTHKQ